MRVGGAARGVACRLARQGSVLGLNASSSSSSSILVEVKHANGKSAVSIHPAGTRR